MLMTRRTLAIALASGLLTSLGWSLPSQAGTLYLSHVGIYNTTGQVASELDVTFTGLTTTVRNLDVFGALDSKYNYIPVSATTAVNGSTIKLFFSPGLSSAASLLLFSFESQSGSIDLGAVAWKVGASDPPGLGFVNTSAISLPEPGSMALLGIGMIGLLTCRRLLGRKAN